MGMQLHGFTYHVGDLLETAVIHIVKRLQDSALDRLQAVINIRDCPLFNDIRGILDEVFIKELVELPKISIIFHGGVNTVDFYNQAGKALKKS